MFIKSKEYVYIVYLLWQVVDYYSKELAIVPEENPTKTENELINWSGMKLIRCVFDIDEGVEAEFNDIKKQELLNLYLQYVLLPEQTLLKKFCFGDGYYTKMEALYVHEVRTVGSKMYVDAIFIDNTLAYQTARHRESEIALKSI